MQTKNTDSRRPHKENDSHNPIKVATATSAVLPKAQIIETKEPKLKPAKEESMADKHFTAENPLWSYAGQAQDAWKELYGFQVKTTQSLVDQAMKFGQTYTDHLYTQVNEATRLSQEALKAGAHLSEELKKNYYSMTEKVTK